RQADAAVNGGLPQVDATFSFALSNSNAGLAIGWGETVLDEITWASSPAGAALNLDPDRFDPDANDELGNWCPATDPYGDGDLGTPGGPNIECPIEPPDGQCMDGGWRRPAMKPGRGDLVITEVTTDPAAVADASGEWFEIRANATFDLNGLEMGRE